MIENPTALVPRDRPASSRRSERVSVVLPCLNEAGSVASCVREARAAMEASGIDGEVVVVDNGSTDGSDRLALEAGARIIHEAHPGYGSALIAGIVGARGDVVVMADADVSYDLSRIPELVRPVLEGEVDMMLGTRVASRKTMPFLHRFVGTPVLTFLVARASGRRATTDSQSGFRAFRRQRFLTLGVRGTGMEFASELLIKATRAGWRISETPIGYRARVGESKLSTFRDGWRHLQLIVLLAPDLVLIWPGLAALALGVFLSVWSLLDPGGIHLGSLRWQPVFFSTIAMVVGAQALLAGLVIAHQSSMGAPRQRASFIASARFLRWCTRGGAITAAIGLLIDLILFVIWVRGGQAPDRAVQLASLAQGLIMVGITAMAFGLVTRLVMNGRAREAQDRELPVEGAA
jgi:glycosyltransferase involved in cell wall biosynthesis